jgi:phosphomannomutase / phosphoglucomutase
LASRYEMVTVDGARAVFEHGWGLVRASNTQPAITLRFEAYTNEQLVEYMHIFKAELDKHPEIDQSKFTQVIASFGG